MVGPLHRIEVSGLDRNRPLVSAHHPISKLNSTSPRACPTFGERARDVFYVTICSAPRSPHRPAGAIKSALLQSVVERGPSAKPAGVTLATLMVRRRGSAVSNHAARLGPSPSRRLLASSSGWRDRLARVNLTLRAAADQRCVRSPPPYLTSERGADQRWQGKTTLIGWAVGVADRVPLPAGMRSAKFANGVNRKARLNHESRRHVGDPPRRIDSPARCSHHPDARDRGRGSLTLRSNGGEPLAGDSAVWSAAPSRCPVRRRVPHHVCAALCSRGPHEASTPRSPPRPTPQPADAKHSREGLAPGAFVPYRLVHPSR